jgi:hypothetical protein
MPFGTTMVPIEPSGRVAGSVVSSAAILGICGTYEERQ